MKRAIGYLLAGLGVFLLMLAVMLKFYVVPSLAQAPLVPGEDTDGVSVSLNEGSGTFLDIAASLAAGEATFREDVPLVNTRFTRGDVQASESTEATENNLAVYDSFSRLTDPEDEVMSGSTLRVAFDRNTSELANCCGANVDGQEVTFSGMNPLKFPFFVEKQSYPYFDTTLSAPYPIDYVGEEEVFGLNTYVFEQSIPATKIGELEVPGGLIGEDAETVAAGRYYENFRRLWIDPVTGSVINGSEDQKQTLQFDGEVKAVVVEASLIGPDAAVQKTVEDTESSSNLLGLLNSTVPLVCVVLGALALIGGILLGRKPADDDDYLVADDAEASA